MSPEKDFPQKLFPDLPDELGKAEVSRLSGASLSCLGSWEKGGLLTPEKTVHPHTSVVYSQQQLARAVIIKFLRNEGWDYPELRNELVKPGYIQRHMGAVKEIIDKNSSGTSQ